MISRTNITTLGKPMKDFPDILIEQDFDFLLKIPLKNCIQGSLPVPALGSMSGIFSFAITQ